MAIVESPAAAGGVERVSFSGTGGEYFRIWIVNLALSIVTLGIYSAWAKVRRLQYFHGNTRVAGHAFGYHGEPLAILKGRIIGVVALAIYAGVTRIAPAAAAFFAVAYVVLLPWIVTRARMFQMRMTSYRGVRFEFDADYGGAFRTLLLAPILIVLSLGLLLPWVVRQRYQWLIDNTAYGNSYFKLDTGLRPVAMAALRTLGIALVVALIGFGLFAGLGALAVFTLGPESPTEAGLQSGILLTVIPLYLVFLVGSYVVLAYWRRSILNLMLPATRVGPLQLQCSLSARKLVWIYVTNILGIVLTVGLFTPWARVRSAKYLLESTGFVAEGPIESFVATEAEKTSAVGEEVGELLDVGVGI